jgi:putative membrane protein
MKQFALLQPIHINYLQFNVIISAIIVGVFLQIMACGSEGYSVRDVGFAMNTASQRVSKTETNIHPEMEARFLSTMTQCHIQQIKLGQLAQKRSGSSEVKAIGKRMEQEHMLKLREVIALAKKKSISIPSAPNEMARATYASLSILTGAEFDKAYHTAIAEAQKIEASVSDRATLAATDPEIKAMAMNIANELKLQLDHSVVSK